MSTTVASPAPAAPANAPLPFGYDPGQYLQDLFAGIAQFAHGAEGNFAIPFSLVEWTGKQRPRSYSGHFTQFQGNFLTGLCSLPSTGDMWNVPTLRVSITSDTEDLTVDGITQKGLQPPHLSGKLRLHGDGLISLARSADGRGFSPGSTTSVILLSIADEFSNGV